MSEGRFAKQIPNDQKMAELIVYLANHCESDPKFGATKLNKLLFFTDFLAYTVLGHSITGHAYQSLPQGPAPKQLLPIRRALEENGDIAIVARKIDSGREFHRIIPKREADLDVFTKEELELVHVVTRNLWNDNADQVSDRSHNFIGWKFAKEREIIPYEVSLVGRRQPTAAETRYGLELEELARECLGE